MSKKRKNILLLFTDQQRYDSLGCNGADICRTPIIDEIASQGTNFNHAYTANALCSPARGSLLTGLYPHNHGQLSNMGNFNSVFDSQILDKKGYPEIISDSGYNTGYAGKWHLPKEGDGDFWKFDKWYTPKEHIKHLKAKGIDYSMARDEVQPLEWTGDAVFCGPSVLSKEDHYDAWVADRAIEMIDEFNDSDDPYMICAAFHGPHFPYAVPEPYNSIYNPEDVGKWGNFDEQFIDKPIVQQKEMLRWNTSHLTWKDWQKVIAVYWGYCTFIDDQIGRIIDKLKKTGDYEDTAIIFTSDHGDMLGSHRLPFKGWNMYEEANHIPMIIRCPGNATQEQVCNSFVNLVDLMPTMLDMIEVDIPDKLDGRSLLPFLSGQEPDGWMDEGYSEFNGYESSLASIRMVRTQKWKYVYNPFSNDELYDMESDPNELYNVAGKLAFKHVLRRMKDRMIRKLKQHNDGIVDITSWQSNSYDLFISDREK